jgi:hypothetical protein
MISWGLLREERVVFHVFVAKCLVDVDNWSVALQFYLHLFIPCLFDDWVDDGEEIIGSSDHSVHLYHSSEFGLFLLIIKDSVGLCPYAIETCGNSVTEGSQVEVDFILCWPYCVDGED